MSPARPRRAARRIAFDSNPLFQLLVGPENRTLGRLEELLGVSLDTHGNEVSIRGPARAASQAEAALGSLYARLASGRGLEPGDVDAAVRLSAQGMDDAAALALAIPTRKRTIVPRSAAQGAYVQAMRDHELVFGLGPAGTGKTYLAVAQAVSMMMAGQVDRLVLSRPAVEAGERLGFLPGDLREKVDPYLRTLYDALHDMLPGDQVFKRLESGDIEVAPLAFMRGRTLANAFVILDEAQNTTPVQMKMFLTRLGENSRMVVTGDPSQVDLPPGARSGLWDALETLAEVPGVAMVRFSEADVVRHGLVTRIVRAYDERMSTRAGAAPVRPLTGGAASEEE